MNLGCDHQTAGAFTSAQTSKNYVIERLVRFCIDYTLGAFLACKWTNALFDFSIDRDAAIVTLKSFLICLRLHDLRTSELKQSRHGFLADLYLPA